MESIRVSNLRCIADSTTIEIKPISLLVGANSSGKSTFLRVFPLLRQSHEMRTLGGLVLNEGDVNFGFFNEALHKDADPAELKIEFGFTMQHGFFQGASWNNYLIEPIEISCELTYAKRAKDHHYPRLRVARLRLTTSTSVDNLSITAGEDGELSAFDVNEFQSSSDERRSLRLRIARGLVPQLVLALNKQDGLDGAFDVTESGSSPFGKRLISETEAFFHGRTAVETRLATFQDIRIGSPQKMLDDMRNSGVSTWRDRISGWTTESVAFLNVRNLLLAKRMNEILESVNVYVTRLAKSVYYFQPVRASAERDYLSRDVSVTSVNPSGLNVAMVLASLSLENQKNFREWMRKHFGFEVFPQSVGDGARVALRMKEAVSGTEFNLADTGFGFSQMLPFLVQVWNLTEGMKSMNSLQRRFTFASPSRFGIPGSSSSIIAIEQPELHLHPALQAKLADLIVAMANLSKAQQVPIRFILETHSQTIIERIGQSVECKILPAEDVQVILFELDRTKPTSNTSVMRTTSFDAQGVLLDWPFGFLSAPLSQPITPPSAS